MIVPTILVNFMALGVMGSAPCFVAQSQTAAPSEATAIAAVHEGQTAAGSAAEGTAPESPAWVAQQIRDKKGHLVFDARKAPVLQTATELGYDEKGKKIAGAKGKSHKMTPISISAGTLTVDGWTAKARLNYDISDFKYLYIYAPGIGTAIVSTAPFPGAREQADGFNDQVLRIMVDGHPMELSSETRLLGKKPVAAWVMIDRGFLLATKFPVFGYGPTAQAPYAWPGAKDTAVLRGPIQAPPLPKDVSPTLLLAPCAVGMMRAPAPLVRAGHAVGDQPCVSITPHATVIPAASVTSSAPASPSLGIER